MTHKMHNAPGGNRGEAGRDGNEIVTINDNIVTDIPPKRNLNKRRLPKKAVTFSLALAAPIDEPSEVDDKRFRFLFYMRERLPSWLWLSAKERAVIHQDSIDGLSTDEAQRFVNAFGQWLGVSE